MLNQLDLRQIRYFLALYQEHSITRAAEKLNVVQPAVSMQIRRLEGHYGVELFERTSSGVFPNKIADKLYGTFTTIMGEVESAHHYLMSATGRISGDISVGIPPSLALGPAHRIVRRYTEEFPDVKLRMVEGYSSNLVEWLGSNELDIAILSTEYSGVRLSEVFLLEEPLVVLMHEEGGSGRVDSIGSSELQALNLVLPSSGNLLRSLIDEFFEANAVTVDPRLEIDSLGTVVRLVQTGSLATILPRLCAQEVAKGTNLRIVNLTPVLNRKLVAAHASRRALSPAAESFIEILIETLSPEAEDIPREEK